MKFAITLLLTALIATPSLAATKLLSIVRINGDVQIVTDEDLKAIGEITIETSLIGDDNKERVHKVIGPRFRDVLRHFSVEGTIADAIALDAYRINIPVEDAEKYDVVLATSIDGKKLTARDRGPLWIIYPLSGHPELMAPLYEARSVWQLKELRMK